MALYGYERDTMPAIETFARTGVVFDNAVVPRGSTRPSYTSMLTGLYPYRHGVRTNGTLAHDDLTTLPELLKPAGYHTAAFVGNYVLNGELSGLDQGFDVYDDDLDESILKHVFYERTARSLVQAVLKWLDGDPPQPWFLFTNFMDPHGPYKPPDEFRKLYPTTRTRLLRRDQISFYQYQEGQLNFYDYVDRYDAEIRYADHEMARLIDALKRRGLWDDALVVFTADHGESFGDHSMIWFEHHYYVWEATLHVPLAIRLPGSAGASGQAAPRRIRDVVSPMDLAPTVLDYLDVAADVRFDGQSLLPAIGGTDSNDRAILLEFPGVSTDYIPIPIYLNDVYAIRTATHKLIQSIDRSTGETRARRLYDLVADPREQAPIRFDANDALHRSLADRLDDALARARSYKLPFTPTVHDLPIGNLRELIGLKHRDRKPSHKPLTKQQAQRLRALGYVP